MGRLILFLVINFGALALGSAMIGNPASNEWYQAVNKAPWTPPGWVFGAAWTTIMVCFSIFLWQYSKGIVNTKEFYGLFAVQFLLNVLWNPMFFRWHYVLPALVMIVLLTVLVAIFTVWGFRRATMQGVLMLPYLVWLCIAASLNGYVLLKN